MTSRSSSDQTPSQSPGNQGARDSRGRADSGAPGEQRQLDLGLDEPSGTERGSTREGDARGAGGAGSNSERSR